MVGPLRLGLGSTKNGTAAASHTASSLSHISPATKGLVAGSDQAGVDDAEHRIIAQLQGETSQSLFDDTDEEAKEHWFLGAASFKTAIGVAVCVNTVALGIEADHPEWTGVWPVCENVFTAIFFCEMVVKLALMRLSYFDDAWNWLDGALVCMGVLDCWILVWVTDSFDLQVLSILRLLRLVRLARLLRLVKRFQQLVLVIHGVIEAIKATFWVALLMTLVIYIGAVFCTGLIGHGNVELYPGYTVSETEIDEKEVMTEFNPHTAFGSISKSMLTLFNIAILAEWSEVVRPLMIKEPMLVVFFVGFGFFVTFGVLNVMVAIIVDRVMEHAREIELDQRHKERNEKLQVLRRIQELVANIDTDNDGKVFASEIREHMQNSHSPLSVLLGRVDLPRGFSADELVQLLDADGDGAVEHEEFVQSFFRMIDCDQFQQICLVQMGINSVKAHVNENSMKTQQRFDNLESSLATLSAELGATRFVPDASSTDVDRALFHKEIVNSSCTEVNKLMFKNPMARRPLLHSGGGASASVFVLDPVNDGSDALDALHLDLESRLLQAVSEGFVCARRVGGVAPRSGAPVVTKPPSEGDRTDRPPPPSMLVEDLPDVPTQAVICLEQFEPPRVPDGHVYWKTAV